MRLGEWDGKEKDREYEEKENGWDKIPVYWERNIDNERRIKRGKEDNWGYLL